MVQKPTFRDKALVQFVTHGCYARQPLLCTIVMHAIPLLCRGCQRACMHNNRSFQRMVPLVEPCRSVHSVATHCPTTAPPQHATTSLLLRTSRSPKGNVKFAEQGNEHRRDGKSEYDAHNEEWRQRIGRLLRPGFADQNVRDNVE